MGDAPAFMTMRNDGTVKRHFSRNRPLTPEPMIKKQMRFFNPEMYQVAYNHTFAGDFRRYLLDNWRMTIYMKQLVRRIQRMWRRYRTAV